jgi:surfactin synthase thioesterase subunit
MYICNTDIAYSEDWTAKMMAQGEGNYTKVQSNFTWIVGANDPSTKNAGPAWEKFTSGVYQQIVFNGDHFFIFQDDKKDEIIAGECVRCLFRNLDL